MSDHNVLRATSTPAELSQTSQLPSFLQNEDSGYQSYSTFNSSVETSLERSKFRTPDNLLATVDESITTPATGCSPWRSRKSPRMDMSGRRFVDFLYHLGVRDDYSTAVKVILGQLGLADLYNASMVSKVWRSVIASIPREEVRLRQYARMMQAVKENVAPGSGDSTSSENCEEKNSYRSLRSTLNEIQNIQPSGSQRSTPSSSSPILSPTYRYEAYRKEASKLKRGKRLYSCPKCKLPSHLVDGPQSTAKCTNDICHYRFCILCNCEEHSHKKCNFISTPVGPKSTDIICSTKSKKNLRRLLL